MLGIGKFTIAVEGAARSAAPTRVGRLSGLNQRDEEPADLPPQNSRGPEFRNPDRGCGHPAARGGRWRP